MFDKLFKKKNETIIYAPVKGSVVDISEVPDPVFSEKMMGEGVAIIPEGEIICSPIDGHVIQIFKTKHAISLQSSNGLEIIIHIGLETVTLEGVGFEVLIKENEAVTRGKPLIKVDLELLKNKGINLITPVVIVNHEGKNIEKYLGNKTKKDSIIKVL